MENNSRLQELGIKTLAASFKASFKGVSTRQSHNKRSKKEDSGSEYDPVEDEAIEGDEIDNSSLDEEEPLTEDQPILTGSTSKTSKQPSKKAGSKTSKMTPGGARPTKKVKAPPATQQSTRVSTRSTSKQLALAPGHEERAITPGHEQRALAPIHEERIEEELESTSVNNEERPPSAIMEDRSEELGGGDVGNSEEHNQIGDEDTLLSAERGKRPQTRGILLDRMNKAMGRRLPITIVEGKRRPEKPVQAAKFAAEASIAIRQGVPIPTHWKEYKKNENVLNSFMGSLAGKLAVDTNDKPTKDACADVLKCGLRQMRYRLKKNYFDSVPANEVSTTSPVPYMDNVEWRNLVAKWSDPKNKETCEKNKQNRAKVKFHQATGSRSYIAHCYSIEKYKDQEPNAVDLFKECHNSKKRGFSEPVKQAINHRLIWKLLKNPLKIVKIQGLA